jgi:hypothetical protein
MRFRELGRFEKMRAAYAAWDASMPPIPPDAKVSLVSGPHNLAQPS